MTVTIKDVATKAGVSLSTVSLVLNKKQNVREETRLKVLQVIDELDYHPRRIARGLASKKSGNIGFILTDDHFSRAEPFYTKVFLGSEFESRKHHYYVLLTTVSKTFRKDQHVPRFLLEKNVDGIILAGRVPHTLIEHIRTRNLPFILIDFLPKMGPCYAVLMDNFNGAYQAVTYLVRKGHRRIAFLAGDMEHPSLRERFDGYKKALSDSGIPLNTHLTVIDEPYTAFQDGYDAACKLLSRDIPFTALFAGNDAMAHGCLRCFNEHEIRVPEKVAVVGFDDIQTDVQTEPYLTTIRVNKEELGAVAVRRLVEMIDSEQIVFGKTLLPVELVLRKSTGEDSQS